MDAEDPFAGLEDWARATERKVQRESRHGGARRLAVFGVALLLAVAVAVPVLRHWHPFGVSEPGAPSAYPTSSVPAGLSVVMTASAAPTDPFEGTAAASYPIGAAGITLPPAKAVPGFTALEVSGALTQVRSGLIAGRLAAEMLIGHDAKPFVALLAPNARDSVRKWFSDTRFSSVATWIDPTVKLDPAENPRVSGRITYTSAKVGGINTLEVTTNFVWVYAFTGPDHPLAVEHDEIRWDFPSPHNLRAADKGMWIGPVKSYAAWVDCTAADRGMLAPTGAGAAERPKPLDTEDPDAFLRADHTLDITDECGPPKS